MENLSPLEAVLKSAFLAYPELTLQLPFYKKDLPEAIDFDKRIVLEQVLNELSHEKVTEQELIATKADVATTKHIRYLPANYHYHEFFEIIYVAAGSCENYFATQSFKLQKGDIVIIAPHTLHAISGFSDELELYNILIRKSTFHTSFFGLLEDKDVLSSFFLKALYDEEESFLLFHTNSKTNLRGYIDYMQQEMGSHELYAQRMLKNLVDAFFIFLLRAFQKNDAQLASETLQDTETVDILQYLQNNFEDLTITEIADQFNYSQRQIARILKKVTGKTFSQLILELKISKAKYYLKQTDLPIQEIAELVGYPDLSNFYRYFSKVTGFSPKQYRARK